MENTNSISQLSNIVIQKSKLIYEFVNLYNRYAGISRDYGNGEEITMSEAHTLEVIGEHPEITITELSKIQHKTTGAVAQIITKLDQKDYLVRSPHKSNKKKVCYSLSGKGQELIRYHRQFDIAKFSELLASLMQEYSQEELDLFFRIIESYNKAIEKRIAIKNN